jgi:hypothetical protein
MEMPAHPAATAAVVAAETAAKVAAAATKNSSHPNVATLVRARLTCYNGFSQMSFPFTVRIATLDGHERPGA